MKAANEKGTHTERQWLEMIEFFSFSCVRCETNNMYGGYPTKDHIKPIYQGGCGSIRNLQPLCRNCNSKGGAEIVDYRPAYCEKYNLKMPKEWQYA
jgi:5-methylcytosine-specific restriction endonuclease McrA